MFLLWFRHSSSVSFCLWRDANDEIAISSLSSMSTQPKEAQAGESGKSGVAKLCLLLVPTLMGNLPIYDSMKARTIGVAKKM
jgi:hypothetical protein